MKWKHGKSITRPQCMMPRPKTYLNLIFCFRICSIHASMKAVIVILSAWTRASSDNGATPSKTWPITVWAARDAYSLGLLGKPVHQRRNTQLLIHNTCDGWVFPWRPRQKVWPMTKPCSGYQAVMGKGSSLCEKLHREKGPTVQFNSI